MTKPVSKTAFYCGGVRMSDARSDDPLVGDTFAERLMGPDGEAVFESFRGFDRENASNIVRHRIIDDLLRERFKGHPERLTVLIGAGLDTRAFRMRTGTWVEFDEPEIIERKERLLPAASCPVPLRRIPIEFAHERLEEKLAPFVTDKRVSVVMEGVTMYLDEADMRATAQTLCRLFPVHSLICDFTTAAFFRRYGARVHRQIEALGARFTWTPDDPVGVMASSGYRLVNRVSIPLRAAELGRLRAPVWLIRRFLPSLRDGYSVHVFKPE